MKNAQYRAQPLRRIYIPKEEGRQSPISIPSLFALRYISYVNEEERIVRIVSSRETEKWEKELYEKER